MILDWLRNLLFPKESAMLAEITELKSRVAALQIQVNGATSNATNLKQSLDLAIADNIRLQGLLDSAQGQALSAEDRAALVQASADLTAATQALSDSTATTNPAN